MAQWQGLVDAVDAANGAERFGEAEVDARELVAFLLDRQVRAGRNSGLFEPTGSDYAARRLPTGERLKTKLATLHVMSHEAARLLHARGAGNPRAEGAVERAAARFGETCYALQHCTVGECAASFAGYLRFLATTQGDAAGSEIVWRLRTLADHRDGRGHWDRFPLFYTALVLADTPLPVARDELAYAAPALEGAAGRGQAEAPYADRRRALVQLVRARLATASR